MRSRAPESGELRKPFTHALRPGYGDTDQSGVVHHAVYLRWYEDARVAYLRDRGADFAALEAERVGMAVHQADLKYMLPARFDDDLRIEVWVGELGRARLRFDYRVWKGEDLLSEASIHIACIHLDRMRAIRIPDSVRRCCS